MLVAAIAPWGIGELLRALLPFHPELDVYRDVRVLESLPMGSKLILVPRREDAWALNMARPILSRRELKVILACDREMSETLVNDAPDFFDWISIYTEWPEKPAPHAVHGIRHSVQVRAPGIVWLDREGSDPEGHLRGLEMVLEAALPGRQTVDIDPLAPFDQIVGRIRGAKASWSCVRASDPRILRRMRWALMDAGRRAASIFIAKNMEGESSVSRFSPWVAGFAPVHSAIASFEESHGALAQVGAQHPGRLAALAGYEPEAISLCTTLLAHGEHESSLLEQLLAVEDPGALLARIAFDRGVLTPEQCDVAFASPPVFRAFAQRRNIQMAVANVDDPVLAGPRRIDEERAALHAFKVGDYNAGIAWGERVEPNERSAELWLRLGQARFDGGDRTRGLSYLRNAVRRAADVADPLYATCRIAVIGALAQLGKFDQAKFSADRAIASIDSSFGAKHSAIAQLMLVIAEVYRRSGNFLVADIILHRLLGEETYDPSFSNDEAEEFVLEHVEQDFPQSVWAIDEWWHTADPISDKDRWRVLAELGNSYLWQELGVEAYANLANSVRRAELELGPDAPEINSLREVLMNAAISIERYGEAEYLDNKRQDLTQYLFPLHEVAAKTPTTPSNDAKIENAQAVWANHRRFEIQFRKVSAFIRYKLRRYGIVSPDSDDVEQDIYAWLLARKHDLSGRQSPTIVELVASAATHYNRRTTDGRTVFGDDVHWEEIADQRPSSLDLMQAHETLDQVWSALNKLPVSDRHVIGKYLSDELTIAEIAVQLNITPAAAAKRIQRAIAYLRDVVSSNRTYRWFL